MDDLLDLEWDKKPSAGVSSAPRRNDNGSTYNFDALTRSLPQAQAQQQNRTNGYNANNQKTNTTYTNFGSTKPASSSRLPSQQSSTTSGPDAFSSLLGFDTGSSSAASTNISMAERLKRERMEKMGMAPPKASTTSAQSPASSNSAWEGLDSFLSGPNVQQPKKAPVGTNRTATSSQAHPNANDDDLWNFDSTPEAATSTKAAPPAVTQTKSDAPKAPKSSKKDLFDFSEFEDPGESQSSALGADEPASKATKAKSMLQRPSYASDEDDDLLGNFGRRHQTRAQDRQTATEPQPRQQIDSKSNSRSASPPPHIIGQIVEMGFSPLQARQALAATDSGLNVSAAIEMLLSEAASSQPQQDEDHEGDSRMAMRLQREEERQSRRMRDPQRNERRREAEEDRDRNNSGLDIPVEWQKQADQIYNQASEIGASMFSKANALWSTAKAQAQRAIDERSGNDSGQSSGRSSPAAGSERAKNRRWAVPSREGSGGQRKDWQGRPKWMVDAADEDESEAGQERTQKEQTSNSFRDDDDVASVKSAPSSKQQGAHSAKASSQTSTADLWGEETNGESNLRPTPPQTSRRSSPLATSSAAGSASTSRPAASAKSATASARQAVAKKVRQIIPDEASAVQNSLSHKQRGNDLFKRGAYGEAETAYSSALECLEVTSLRRVAVLNNRANARLRNGDAKSALSDTKAVLTLIVVGHNGKGSPFLLYRPSQEETLPGEYVDVNLREGYAKALLRRGQAEEALEQWETAQSVWSLLEKYEKEEGSGKAGIVNLRAAQEGSKRCAKMLKGGDVELTVPATRRVHAAAVQAIAKAELAAKERIRSENAVAAAEDAEKDRLRASVDAKVSAWKNGKETNIRALLASLHEVVWAGLNWKRVGMHELVLDNQVKRCYMRAIGKLHPDKLTPKTSSIEERMIGGSVFSALNEAWSAASLG